MNTAIQCPVCLNAHGDFCLEQSPPGGDRTAFDCEICGRFEVSGSALATHLSSQSARLTNLQRAALSHRLRTQTAPGSRPAALTTDNIENFVQNAQLPHPATQVANLIRLIGDYVMNTGRALFVGN